MPFGSGARKQVTGFGAPSQDEGTLVDGAFLDDGTISGFGGGSAFTVNSDGSGFRQLTAYHGMVTEPDGTVTVELPGPIGSSGR